ncbi:unnamed protein product [Meganyctiphanes norvegica]|uniref:Ion transport domain-containing protein n=1 Tax=Meganyctiphanes norvegica TaxID=48144 RepID=A0AAV2QUF0_MEGNR
MAGYLALKSMEANGGGGSEAGNSGTSYATLQELLAAVQTNDIDRLRVILPSVKPQDINYIHRHPVQCTLLHIAVQNNQPDLANLLIKHGADPNMRDLRGKKYVALHYAAENGYPQVMQTLLQAGADPNIKEGEFGRTCLHILTLKWKSNEDDYKECLDMLLDLNKVKIDIQDSQKASPLFLAAVKSWDYMTRQLILRGANIDCSVGNKTAADHIRKKLPGLLESIDFSLIEKPKRHFSEELYDAMKDNDIMEFKKLLDEVDDCNEDKVGILEEDHGEYTLLQDACDNGRAEFVEVLLSHGADPMKRDETSKGSPILYATRNGYYIILEMLIGTMKKLGELEKGGIKQVDRRGETALHKVVKREYLSQKEGVDYKRCLELLLKYKKYLNIDALDEFGNTPLHYAVLCDDQSFVRYLLLNGAHLGIKNKFGTLAITRIQSSVLEEVLNECIKHKNNVADRDFEIILNYSMLVPTHNAQQPETECLRFLSGSRAHRHLLRHPIIDTFLFLKWQRIRQYYFFNTAAYLFYLILLTAYILIYHGVIKDQQPANANITTSTVTTIPTSVELHDNMALKVILQVFISIFALYLALREGVQFMVSPRLYVSRLENWLEITIVIMTAVLLFLPVNVNSQHSLAAWLILFSWTEFILLIGRHPWMAVYITMFTTVSYNFLKFIMMFSFMVFAFTISFYLVFQVDENFMSYAKTLMKTIAMSTGELEYTDLPLDKFPVSSHLLFLLFTFLIVLVLMNLLNGLAVNDIQLIQQEAEIVSYSSRVELISYIESVFLAGNSPLSKVVPGPITCCEANADDCFVAACLESPNPAIKLLNWLGRRTLMFRTCIPNHRITMYPNRNRGQRWEVCKCHNFDLEESHIESAMSVVLADEHKVADRLSVMEERLLSVDKAIISLTEMVRNHVLCPSPSPTQTSH